MTSVVKSRSLVRDGRSFRACWYVQRGGLFFVGVTITNGKNTTTTHLAHASADSADNFVNQQMDLFIRGIETQREF